MKAITNTLNVSRSNQYEKTEEPRQRHHQKAKDDCYLPLIRQLVDQRPTYGYRRITALFNRQLEGGGLPRVNHKRVYRIMKLNGLLLQRYTGKPTRTHRGTIIQDRSNRRWCSDVFEIPCWSGERLRIAFSLDCCDREVMSYVANTGGISGDMVKDLMVESLESRFGQRETLPYRIEWFSDNGPAYIARKTKSFDRMLGFEVCTTLNRSPESNGMAESFMKTFKRDYVHINHLYDARTVMEQLPKWFDDYNKNHPHKGLKIRPPREYRRIVNTLETCPVL